MSSPSLPLFAPATKADAPKRAPRAKAAPVVDTPVSTPAPVVDTLVSTRTDLVHVPGLGVEHSTVARWVLPSPETMTMERPTLPRLVDVLAAARVDVDDARPTLTPEQEREAKLCTSRLVAALERSYAVIRGFHPAVPHAMCTLGSGTEKVRGSVQLTHEGSYKRRSFVDTTGIPAPGEAVANAEDVTTWVPEVMVAAETLDQGAAHVFTTLLHEAAHGLAYARKYKGGGTSRGGRYHNEKYAAVAREMLMDVAQGPTFGWHDTTLTPAALDRYAGCLADLAHHLGAYHKAVPRAVVKTKGAPSEKPAAGLMLLAAFGPVYGYFPALIDDGMSLGTVLANLEKLGSERATVYLMHKPGLTKPGPSLFTWTKAKGLRVEDGVDDHDDVPEGLVERLSEGARAFVPLFVVDPTAAEGAPAVANTDSGSDDEEE